ncbi:MULTISPECIES: hypothetical protein [Sorangium]|uniref:Uncharacterized protein n=1 Tax=Sorangium cellulosum TaxID=56 RepID=A0A4P2R0G0_SORCE|nr:MULTISPECIES: hypothetical protein [Sorangium]AUX36325.1 uncharacterized protein SOCE836_085320 [Sorangium cellulosum]WCQ95624.1 hypothetical protein NQZ70_08401 [Sorangium sp. Soce836]
MEAVLMQPKELPYWGVDLCPEDRPGVPREAPPHLLSWAHWIEPERQPVEGRVLRHPGLARPTPVFSTALPPRGASGVLRRLAYEVPDHKLPHWILLMIADRVDVLESLPLLFTHFKRRAVRAGKLRSAASRRVWSQRM